MTRTGTSVSAIHGAGAVSVTTFRLLKPYRPALRVAVVKELDGVAAQLAAELHGRVVATRPVRARQYDLAFVRNGDNLVERITFVLRGRHEYELLCRFKEGKSDAACALLQSSFRAG